jgi:hypothetical protein
METVAAIEAIILKEVRDGLELDMLTPTERLHLNVAQLAQKIAEAVWLVNEPARRTCATERAQA